MLRKILPLGIVALLGGCDVGADYTGSYSGGDETALIQLNLVEADNGQINATVAVSELDYKKGKLSTQTAGFTGIRDGNSINLIAANGSGNSLAISGKGDKLTIQVPRTGQSIELAESSQAEYQEQLVKLNNQLYGNDVGLLPDDL